MTTATQHNGRGDSAALNVVLHIHDSGGNHLGTVRESFPDLDCARVYARKRPGIRYFLEAWGAYGERVTYENLNN